jgi:hypothetical protein
MVDIGQPLEGVNVVFDAGTGYTKTVITDSEGKIPVDTQLLVGDHTCDVTLSGHVDSTGSTVHSFTFTVTDESPEAFDILGLALTLYEGNEVSVKGGPLVEGGPLE